MFASTQLIVVGNDDVIVKTAKRKCTIGMM